MAHFRLIARMDIKAPKLIKTINLEGVRVVGDPREYVDQYYAQGIDEIVYIDAVASLYGRNHLTEVIEYTAENVFVPITAGGGIRSVDDAVALLRAGADKIAINTFATQRPELITEIANRFGSQCMVLSIPAKRRPEGGWEVYRDGGREHSGLDAVEWAKRGEALGAGEIFLTSIDREGTRKGFDVDLVSAVSSAVTIPVIASGGMGQIDHLLDIAEHGGVNAVAIAHVLHYGTMSLPDLREQAISRGLNLRTLAA